MASKKTSNKFDLNRLSDLLGVTTPDDYLDKLDSYGNDEAYSYAYKEAIADGKTEEEAEEAAMAAEGEIRDEAWRKYTDAVQAVADDLFEKHNLTLVPVKFKRKVPPGTRPWEYTVEPTKSWEDAAGQLITTINGVGQFEFASVKDFLDSGPYTARGAVLGHLHWIRRYPDVYGDRGIQDRIDRSLRY